MKAAHDLTEPSSGSHPVSPGPKLWKRSLSQAFVVLWLPIFFANSGVAAEDNDGPVRFHEVNAWRGTLVATARENPATMSLHDQILRAAGGKKTHWNFQFNTFLSVDFVLDEYESDPSVWTGKVTGSHYEAGYHYFAHVPESDANRPDWKGYVEIEWNYTANGPLDFSGDPRVELQFHRERGWSVRMSSGRLPTEARSLLFRHAPTEQEQNPDHDLIIDHDTTTREASKVTATGMGSTDTHPYPKTVSVLLGSNDKKEGGFPLIYGTMGVAPDVLWDYTVYLEPTSMDELRLVIEEPAEYATWRPETTPDTAAGAVLEVTARVETAKGGVPKTKVQQFVWELIQTSKEPGVAMNWPLEAKDNRFDLDLDAAGGHFQLSNEKQKLERAVQQGFSDTVKVVPYDWGGWSTLQVTAIMTDGRRVRGKLKGKSETGLRVPKRDPQSHIADAWKNQHKSGADDLDDDKVEGQPDNGDGFSLYEEYRGWVMDGQHMGGDPEQKDFFVLNLIGADAQTGIDLFTAVSQLEVHDRLKPAEMSEEKRLMNGNHKQGAHVVDQHGVWIKSYGSKSDLGGGGAFTVLEKTGVAGRPGLVKGVGILSRTNEESDFTKPFNLAPQDTAGVYDRAIAHELLHTVGVEHHGDKDYKMIVGYCSMRNPSNKLGRPYYGRAMDDPIDLRTEDGQDVAQRDGPEYEKFRVMMDAALGGRLRAEGPKFLSINTGGSVMGITTVDQYVDWQIETLAIFAFMHIDGIVGVDHGEHSGLEDCLMRYYFAKFYESKKAPAFGGKQYYLVDPGTEHIGTAICQDKLGTGVNASGHAPQSRYGDAANGDCFSQICPNDAVPPRAAK